MTSSVRLVACADPEPVARAKVATLGQEVAGYPDVGALLAGTDVDAVMVATPNHLLAPVSLAAIRAGKHVLTEKPVGLNQEEAASLEGEAATMGVQLMPGYCCRFSFGRNVHELLDAGTVGEIEAIVGVFGCGPLDRGWISDVATGGGPLLFLGSHLVDLVLWFAGHEPTEVWGHLRRRGDTGADETSVFGVDFAGGAMAQCTVTQAAPAFFFAIDVLGRSGRVTLRGWNWLQFELEVYSKNVAAYAQPAVIRPSVSDHVSMMLVPELEEFAAAINEGRAPSVTAGDGRRVLQVLDAVVASDRSASPVRLG